MPTEQRILPSNAGIINAITSSICRLRPAIPTAAVAFTIAEGTPVTSSSGDGPLSI